MTMHLTPQNATITTATVEVKTLTIGTRQVTLAVYRQLHEQRMTAGAIPWGRINHCPDSACKQAERDRAMFGPWPEHCHVVWQLGAELRRTTIWQGSVSRSYDRAAPQVGEIASSEIWQQAMALPQLFIAA